MDDVLYVMRETILIDDRQSSCVLCCSAHQLLVMAETCDSQWTVKWSWKVKQVCTYSFHLENIVHCCLEFLHLLHSVWFDPRCE